LAWTKDLLIGLGAALASSTAFAQDEPGVISGRAVDSLGRPLAGTRIWIRPALTGGLLQTRTDRDGRYRVAGLIKRIPYRAYAWHSFGANGNEVCVRLGHDEPADYEAFVPDRPLVRNFRLRHEGKIEDYDGQVFGGEMRLFVGDIPAGPLDLSFTPDGPLIDGAPSKPFTRALDTRRDVLIYGIPLAAYRVSARAGGEAAQPLDVSATSDSSGFAGEARVEWASRDSCVGSTASGPPRIFLWLRPRR
jgi:hypothetical protein